MIEYREVRGIRLRFDGDKDAYQMGYAAFGGRSGSMLTDDPFHLGFGYNTKRRGGIIWHLAFGYVSGFPISALVWFMLTRSIPPEWATERILDWERRTGRDGDLLGEAFDGEPVHVHDLMQPR